MTKIQQLKKQFDPSHYGVRLTVDPDAKEFHGEVEIIGKTHRNSRSITLHSKDLDIINCTIDGKDAQIGKQSAHHEVEFQSADEISAGEHKISVRFRGTITESMVGIYPSNFTHEGKERKIIATQFESNHAREAIPCIDEPAAKATFELCLTTQSGLTVLSNTPVASEKVVDDKTTTSFERTPVMSSYLLAFVAGDLHSVERKTKNGITINTWASVAQPKKLLNYSADEAVLILDFFEDYFGVPYPLEKCDLVALPDFDAGAMENWGVITFREVAMLADPDNRSISSEQFVSMVLAHELSHMWFGNLVTMEWWDDLWLNESFASLMEHVALDDIHPDWNQWEHYAASDVLAATSRDIHADIQPISIEVSDPDLIETLFDPGIVYTKGGRLLKMLREHIGDDAFRAGLKSYFEEFAYRNTTRSDLWEHLGAASKLDVDSLMTKWLQQPGMPKLSVDQSGTTIKLRQDRFVIGDDAPKSDQLWPIPLLAEPAIPVEILETRDAELLVSRPDFILFNRSASGHYITHYEKAEHRMAIAKMLATQQADSPARVNTLNDLILLSRNDIIQYDEVLDTVVQMVKERRFPVWGLMARAVSTANQLTEGNEVAREHLKLVRAHLAKPLIDELGYDLNHSFEPNDKQLQSLAISFMLGAENSEALDYAKQQIAKAKDLANLPSESRAAMLGAMVRDGGGDDDSLSKRLLESYPNASAEMQLDIVSALASTKDAAVALDALSTALGADGISRPQDVMRWLAIFLRNHYIRDQVWDYMVSEWAWLEKTLTNSKSFDYLPTYCAAVVSTEAMAQKYKDLFVPLKDNKLLKRNIAIGLADIEARVKWRKTNQNEVEAWLVRFAEAQSK